MKRQSLLFKLTLPAFLLSFVAAHAIAQQPSPPQQVFLTLLEPSRTTLYPSLNGTVAISSILKSTRTPRSAPCTTETERKTSKPAQAHRMPQNSPCGPRQLPTPEEFSPQVAES